MICSKLTIAQDTKRTKCDIYYHSYEAELYIIHSLIQWNTCKCSGTFINLFTHLQWWEESYHSYWKKIKINPITILWGSFLNQYMYNVQILSYIYNLFLLIRNRTNVHWQSPSTSTFKSRVLVGIQLIQYQIVKQVFW